MEIIIPDHVRSVIERLEQKGYCAYIVGGCVRDSLLGKTPNDYDVCTDCKPDTMTEIFSDHHVIKTGIQHGTLTVMSQGKPVEITTFRSDGEYVDHRKPAQVTFESSLDEDLKRRDFTVNALCYNEREGLIDLFGGTEDLKNGIIKCVGEPENRFDEDALRILRAMRFASVLGFEIEEETSQAMHDKAGLLKEISAERIFTELKKIITGKNAGRILSGYKDIIGVIIPEFVPTFGCLQNCPHHIYDVYGHICKSVDNIAPNAHLRLTMLLHDIGKPEMKRTDENGTDHFKKHQYVSAERSREILRRLKSDRKTEQKVYDLIWEHDNRIPPQRRAVKRLISKYSYEFFADWLAVRRADTLAQSEYRRREKLAELDELEKIAAQLKEEDSCLKLSDLAVKGGDLIGAGYSGAQIGRALNEALAAVMEEKIPNDRDSIMNYLRSLFNV